jgi:hypothetical protein
MRHHRAHAEGRHVREEQEAGHLTYKNERRRSESVKRSSTRLWRWPAAGAQRGGQAAGLAPPVGGQRGLGSSCWSARSSSEGDGEGGGQRVDVDRGGRW